MKNWKSTIFTFGLVLSTFGWLANRGLRFDEQIKRAESQARLCEEAEVDGTTRFERSVQGKPLPCDPTLLARH